MALYGFSPTNTHNVGVGAGDYAFEPSLGLPPFSLLGVGMPFERQMLPMQPAQAYYLAKQYIIGMSGVVAGQIIGQPLVQAGQFGNL